MPDNVGPAARRLFVAVFLLVLAGLVLAESRRPASSTFGWMPDPDGVREFLDELPERYFAEAAPEAMSRAERRDTFLWRSMDRAHRARYGRPFVVGKQGIGDCCSWGAAHAVYCAESIDWELGKLEAAPIFPATESIYGGSRCEARSRTFAGFSDGSTGFSTAKWLRDWGVVYRQTELGLAEYSAARAKDWGAYGNGGKDDGGKLDDVAKRHPVKHVVAIESWEELVAAITAGFPCTVASDQGFSSRTDETGVARADGRWMHQQAIVGIRFADAAPPGIRAVDAAAILNSWGPTWISYAGKYPEDLPDGAYWAERPVIERMISTGEVYAIGSVEGWGWRRLRHDEFLAPGPMN